MTEYSEIYNSFFNKITDYDLFKNLNETEILSLFEEYMNSAISHFVECKKDLFKKDNGAKMFLVKLDNLEIEIISSLMVVEWLKPMITNTLNLKPFLTDKDYKTYSQANHLKALKEIQSNIQNDIERMMQEYGWRCFDYTKLGGDK